MKKVQIDYELFRKLIFYHLGSDDQYEEDIRNGLEEKLDALVRHGRAAGCRKYGRRIK